MKEKNRNRKMIRTITGITVILASLFICYVFWRLPSDWKEKILFPITLPEVATSAVTNHANNSGFDDKIWIHRVNSIERVKIMAEKYKGIEMDVVWDMDSAQFYVEHDPNPEVYLPLYQMFDNIKNIQEHYFWLDFKNLNIDNKDMALDYLLRLFEKYVINLKNVILESSEPYSLSEFTTAGVATSFYLPTLNPYIMSDTDIIHFAKQIDSTLLKSNVNYVSTNHLSYHFVKKYFPESRILLWHLSQNRFTSYVRKKLVNDDHVKVILTQEYSEGYR